MLDNNSRQILRSSQWKRGRPSFHDSSSVVILVANYSGLMVKTRAQALCRHFTFSSRSDYYIRCLSSLTASAPVLIDSYGRQS